MKNKNFFTKKRMLSISATILLILASLTASAQRYDIDFDMAKGSEDYGKITGTENGNQFWSVVTIVGTGKNCIFTVTPSIPVQEYRWIVNGEDIWDMPDTSTSPSTYTINNVSKNYNIRVEIIPKNWMVTLSTDGNGQLKATMDGNTHSGIMTLPVSHGKDVLITAVPDAGYRVKTWWLLESKEWMDWDENKVVVNGTNKTYLINVTADNQIYVEFEEGQDTGIDNILSQTKTLNVYMQNGTLQVEGLATGKLWSVYNAFGTLVYQSVANGSEAGIALDTRGVYIVRSDNDVVKVVY